MAGSRKSGTRSLAPVSGSVLTSNVPFISQNDTTTVILSSSTNIQGVLKVVGTGTSSFVVIQNNEHNVGNVYNPLGNDPLAPADQSLYSTTDQRKLAEAYFSGGMGIEKDLAVGGFIYGRIAAANTATTASSISLLVVNNDQTYYPVFTDAEGLTIQGAQLYGDALNQDAASGGLRYNPYYGKIISERFHAISQENSTGTSTGALVVDGGAGIQGSVYAESGNVLENYLLYSPNTTVNMRNVDHNMDFILGIILSANN